MGEIAEMMLDGTLDCETGEYLGEGDGYPRTARQMREPAFPKGYMGGRKAKDTPCPKCGRKLRGETGLRDHMKSTHS